MLMKYKRDSTGAACDWSTGR